MASRSPLFFFFFFFIWSPMASSISFNFSSFDNQKLTSCKQGTYGICTTGDATIKMDQTLQLTKMEPNVNISKSIGRAHYANPIPLWSSTTNQLTDFTTNFSFIIDSFGETYYIGHGLAFYLAPYDNAFAPDSDHGGLGLFSVGTYDDELTVATTYNHAVAVEFDTWQTKDWDPDPGNGSMNHVGIDVNSIRSVATAMLDTRMSVGKATNAIVSYNSSTHNLSVFLTYSDNSPVTSDRPTVSYIVDLRKILPEKVAVGFSSTVQQSYERHSVLSWSFTSSLEIEKGNKGKRKVGFVVGVSVAVAAVVVLIIGGLGLVWCTKKRRKGRDDGGEEEDKNGVDMSIEVGFKGLQKFSYKDLAIATNNFSEKRRLGEGGFGTVYKGFLSSLGVNVAIKRVAKGSKQGMKEYISEVKIISSLRHRNLVQLVGWCHDQNELLLVYEFMPKGSLDSFLFKARGTVSVLTWDLRYKIAVGLASALLYLHEEWVQCVVHRDVEASNVLLDSSFNAKLGDFGLARFVDHDREAQTTAVAGTPGYIAPEYLETGRASKESDVYSFGVVALEIACGRRAYERTAGEGKVLVDWVWSLNRKGSLLEAVDQRLATEMEVDEPLPVERLMLVGLWCANRDPSLRPSIKQAIAALHMEAPTPDLLEQMPTPEYFMSASQAGFSPYSTSSQRGASTTPATLSSDVSSGYSTNVVAGSSPPSASLLHSQRAD